MANYVNINIDVSVDQLVDDLYCGLDTYEDCINFIERFDERVCDWDFTVAVAEKFVKKMSDMRGDNPEEFNVFKKRIKAILKGSAIE